MNQICLDAVGESCVCFLLNEMCVFVCVSSCSYVSRRLNELSKHNPLWKSLCSKHWLLSEWVLFFPLNMFMNKLLLFSVWRWKPVLMMSLCVQCGAAAEWRFLVLSVQTVLQGPGSLHPVLPGPEESVGAAEELPAAEVSSNDRLTQRSITTTTTIKLRGWVMTGIRKLCVHMFAFSSEGATEVELNDIEAQIGCRLPDDYRCSYRIHNGQKLVIPGSVSASWSFNTFLSVRLLTRSSLCPQADGQHVPVQSLPLRGAAGRGDGGWRFPAEEGDETLPAAHFLLPHRPQSVHGSAAGRGAQDVRELLPLPRKFHAAKTQI